MNELEIVTLIGLLLLGNCAHVLKKVVEVRTNDVDLADYGVRDYLAAYPYKTALMVITAVGTAAGLHAAGELSWASAFLTGYAAQSVGAAAKGGQR